MVCVCGARLPVDNPVSICNTCLRAEDGWSQDDEDELSDMHADDDDETPLYHEYYGGE
jgi:hypothetical protein